MKPEELQRRLNQAAKDLQKPTALIRNIVETVEGKARQNAPVDTGELRDSISSRVDTAARGFITASAPHAIYVHEGTRYMAARPFIKDAIEQSDGAIRRVAIAFGNDIFKQVAGR